MSLELCQVCRLASFHTGRRQNFLLLCAVFVPQTGSLHAICQDIAKHKAKANLRCLQGMHAEFLVQQKHKQALTLKFLVRLLRCTAFLSALH